MLPPLLRYLSTMASKNGGPDVDATSGTYQLLPVQFTSPPPGKTTTCNVVRFSTPIDDVKASPVFGGLDGRGVRVAVLDTGIDESHPALAGRVDRAASRNMTGGCPGDYHDKLGHGTHVAGIIVAQERPGAIMSGIAPAATLIAVKVFSDAGGTTDWILAAGIRHAVAVGAKVINMSLGGTERPGLERFYPGGEDFYQAVQEALAAGVIVVTSAGNMGHQSDANTINPPGAYGGVVTVASHEDSGEPSFFSSKGGELDMMAPGETFSTWPRGVLYQGRPGREYEHLRGTSMASPLVAGLAALLVQAGRDRPAGMSPELSLRLGQSRFSGANAYEVREVLRSFADRPEEHHRDDGYGNLSAVYHFVKENVKDSQLKLE